MFHKNLFVAILESSYIIRKGVLYAISQIDDVGEIIELQSIEELKMQTNLSKLDVLIVNPLFMGLTAKQDLHIQLGVEKSVAIIALVYNMIDSQLYKSYDGVILINESKSKIVSTFKDVTGKDHQHSNDTEELSDREKEILISLVKGMSNKEIADWHNISIHTVITHRRNITKKLKVHSVSGLTIYAIINNLIDISEIDYQNK